jgi:hypothetical protein
VADYNFLFLNHLAATEVADYKKIRGVFLKAPSVSSPEVLLISFGFEGTPLAICSSKITALF